MDASNNAQHTQPGPIAQQLTNHQPNVHQVSFNGRQLQTGQPQSIEAFIKQLRRRGNVTEEYSDTGQLLKISRELPAKKRVWDWFQLLIIPLILLILGSYFTYQQNQTNLQISQQQHQIDIQISKEHHQTDSDIALDQQRETLLEAYISGVQDLLLHDNLRESKMGEEVRVVARARTLAVLRELDSQRQRLLILFLYEANLINKNAQVISLNGAYLADANFVSANLSGASLSGAYLVNANFSSADLAHVDLSNTDLYDADLGDADMSYSNMKGSIGTNTFQLNEPKSLKGATMPDGSIHP